MICPVCQRCPFVKGVCEDRVNRGRRFFLVGALALPVARKLEALAPALVVPRYRVVDYTTGMTVWIVARHVKDAAKADALTSYVTWALAT